MHYHPRLLIRCYWLWKMSNFTMFPDIRTVAEMDQDYVNDMMKIVGIADYIESQAKAKNA